MMKNMYFEEMETSAWETCDASVLIDDGAEYGSDEQFHAYVQQVVRYYVQEMITADILNSGFDEKLIDLIGNIDVYIPDELCDFYKRKTYYEDALEVLGGKDNAIHRTKSKNNNHPPRVARR